MKVTVYSARNIIAGSSLRITILSRATIYAVTDNAGNRFVTSEGFEVFEIPFYKRWWDWLCGKPFDADIPEILHASAPAGMKCADCTMDEEPCPLCYEAWWQKRHPHTYQMKAEPSAP